MVPTRKAKVDQTTPKTHGSALLTGREWSGVLLAAALLALALPPLPTGPLAWIGIVPLLVALEGTSPRRAALIGYVFGLFYHWFALYWIAFHVDMPRWLAILAWLLAPFILAVYTMATTWSLRVVSRWVGSAWPWVLPFAWTGFEYLRYFSEFAFPWVILGHTQARLLGLIQQADIWGVLGVSFWVAALDVLAYRAVVSAPTGRRKAWSFAGAFVLILAATTLYGRFRLGEIPTKPQNIRIAIVQPNISMDVKWRSTNRLQACTDTLVHQTKRIEPGSADLVVWPETAIPDYIIYTAPGSTSDERVVSPRYYRVIREITEHTGAPLVSGVPANDYREDRQYNSAMLVMPESLTVQSYDKRVLVPFGERVPYKHVFGFLDRFNIGIAHWSPGQRLTVFECPAGTFGLGVCFESVFPNLMRQFVRAGADFLVVVTNDAWFAKTSLIYQHAAFAAFRAIENRVWIVRDANTGISAFFDPWGRMVQSAGVFTQETLLGTIGARERDTLYFLWGDWIGQASLIVTLALLLGAWWFGRREG